MLVLSGWHRSILRSAGPGKEILLSQLLQGSRKQVCQSLRTSWANLTAAVSKVIDIYHDKLNNCLVTKIEMTHLYRVQFWSLPELVPTYEIFCPKTVTSYARLVRMPLSDRSPQGTNLINFNI